MSDLHPGKFINVKFIISDSDTSRFSTVFLIYDVVACLVEKELSNEGEIDKSSIILRYHLINREGKIVEFFNLTNDCYKISSGFDLNLLLTHPNESVRKSIRGLLGYENFNDCGE